MSTLIEKYERLLELRVARESLEASGVLSLDGEAGRERKRRCRALARSYPGVLRELEHLSAAAIATRLEVLGPTRPETLSGANNLGMLLQRTGRLEEAAEYLSNAAGGSAEVLGEDHFYTAIFENNYGDCLTDLGRYDEAIELITRSGAVLAATLGEDHERSTRSRARLARAEAGRSAQ